MNDTWTIDELAQRLNVSSNEVRTLLERVAKSPFSALGITADGFVWLVTGGFPGYGAPRWVLAGSTAPFNDEAGQVLSADDCQTILTQGNLAHRC